MVFSPKKGNYIKPPLSSGTSWRMGKNDYTSWKSARRAVRCYFLGKACQEFTAVMATWKAPAQDQDNQHSNKGDRGLISCTPTSKAICN